MKTPDPFRVSGSKLTQAPEDQIIVGGPQGDAKKINLIKNLQPDSNLSFNDDFMAVLTTNKNVITLMNGPL